MLPLRCGRPKLVRSSIPPGKVGQCYSCPSIAAKVLGADLGLYSCFRAANTSKEPRSARLLPSRRMDQRFVKFVKHRRRRPSWEQVAKAANRAGYRTAQDKQWTGPNLRERMLSAFSEEPWCRP